jgi:hypothetical protein
MQCINEGTLDCPHALYLPTQLPGAFGPLATTTEASAPKVTFDYIRGQAAADSILGSEVAGLGYSVNVGDDEVDEVVEVDEVDAVRSLDGVQLVGRVP